MFSSFGSYSASFCFGSKECLLIRYSLGFSLRYHSGMFSGFGSNPLSFDLCCKACLFCSFNGKPRRLGFCRDTCVLPGLRCSNSMAQ
ncbi:hypothetical protein A584_11122 [Pseudomonas syringae pv. theae ICMP 3923]|nr:hypothetical protein A584_11122 [Pseudomonas syringae pv. theae ICMP 3923]